MIKDIITDVLTLLTTVARQDGPCPTNHRMADTLQVSSSGIDGAIRRLRASGKIAVEFHENASTRRRVWISGTNNWTEWSRRDAARPERYDGNPFRCAIERDPDAYMAERMAAVGGRYEDVRRRAA